MHCSFCQKPLHHTFVDLVNAPPSNAYLSAAQLDAPEPYYPLKVMVCEHCWLVQVPDVAGRTVHFNDDYAYFSSYSPSLLKYSEGYVDAMVARLGLGPQSLAMEVASNDGYLLQYYAKHGVPCYGVEPTGSTAAAAREKGIEVVGEFMSEKLGQSLAAQGKQADLITANNVLAHVPDIADFVRGMAAALKPTGTITVEFQYLLKLVEQAQFDIVYHEHYSYLSLHAVKNVFEACGLTVYDAEEVSTQGGSLRVYARPTAHTALAISPHVAAQLAKETAAGLTTLATYTAFQTRADSIKNNFLAFLLEQKRLGKRVAGYGAAAKGNTMLNYAGVKPDLMLAVADANPHKQHKYLPGSHIPVITPDALAALKPDVVVILPWNLKDEIASQLGHLRASGTRFAVAVPEMVVW